MGFTSLSNMSNASLPTTTSSEFPECKPVFRPDLTVFLSISFLVVLWNALVLWAIVKSRAKLKQNVVYSFVSSLVAANIALIGVFILTLFSFVTPFERPMGQPGFENSPYKALVPAHKRIMYWFNFRKALVVGLFLAMSANVVALISGIIQNASFVGRSGTSNINSKGRNKQRTSSVSQSGDETPKFTRHQKASFSIFLAWIIPLIYTLLSFVQSECIDYCECLPGYYSQQYFCSKPSGQTVNLCSNVWTPMTNGYLLTAVMLWFFDSIAIFILLAKAINKYKSVMKPVEMANSSLSPSTKASIPSSNNRDVNENQSMTASAEGNNAERAISDHLKIDTMYGSSGTLNGSIGTALGSTGTNHGPSLNETFNPLPKRSLKNKPRKHPTIKLLIALSVSYTVCTAPMMACFVVDAFENDQNSVGDITVTISSVIVVLYTVICPGFLVAYMPGLRKALVRFLLPLMCTTTTTVVSRVARLATTKKK